MVLGRPKPDGTAYANTDEDWTWLSGDAGKAARWLGYLAFDQIVDQRNAPPTTRIFKQPRPYPWITVGIDVDLPDPDDFLPQVQADSRIAGRSRLLQVHQNVPGVLATVNGLLANAHVNIEGQVLSTRGELGYVITDVAGALTTEVIDKLESMPETVRLRVLD